MSINVYTCSQADLETLTGVGAKTAAAIIALRKEALEGKRPPLSIHDLAAIRLTPEEWQQFINDGLLSISYGATYQSDKGSLQISPTQFPFSGQLSLSPTLTSVTATVTGMTMSMPLQTTNVTSTINPIQTTGQITIPKDTVTGQMTLGQVTQLTQPKQPTTGQSPTQQLSPVDTMMQESLKILAHHVEEMSHQIHGLGTTLTQRMTDLHDNVAKLEQQNTDIKTHLAFHDQQNFDIQSKLTLHDTFLTDINKLLPPPTPISSMLPILNPMAHATTFQTPKQTLVINQPAPAPPIVPYNPPIASVTVQSSVQKPILTQPTPLLQPIPPPIATQYQSPLDVKPKNPQQVIIDSITAAIPKSAIFTSNITPQATQPSTAQPASATLTQQAQSTSTQSQNNTQDNKNTQQATQTAQTGQTDASGQTSADRGRSRQRKSRSKRSTSAGSSSRSNSPPPPRLQLFSGDPTSLSWTSFIMKFDRIAQRRGWSDEKKLDRLYYCLTDKALEYASKSENKDNFNSLKQELALRFDLKDEPIAARHRLHLAKQDDDESLEAYLQKILTITMDGYKNASAGLIQQMATESFLRGCKHKDAATIVMNESPSTIHEACKRVKTIIANKKAIGGGKVSFQERVFTLEEENRVTGIEKKVDDLTKIIQRSPSLYRSPSRSPPRYQSAPQGQSWPRQRSPDYYRGGSPSSQPYAYSHPSPSRPEGNYFPYRRGYSPNNYPNRSPTRDSGNRLGERYPGLYPANPGYQTTQYAASRGYPSSQPYQATTQRYPPRYPSNSNDGYQLPPPWPYRDKGSYQKSGTSPQRNRETSAFIGNQNPEIKYNPPNRPRSPEALVKSVSRDFEPDLNTDGLGQPATNT